MHVHVHVCKLNSTHLPKHNLVSQSTHICLANDTHLNAFQKQRRQHSRRNVKWLKVFVDDIIAWYFEIGLIIVAEWWFTYTGHTKRKWDKRPSHSIVTCLHCVPHSSIWIVNLNRIVHIKHRLIVSILWYIDFCNCKIKQKIARHSRWTQFRWIWRIILLHQHFSHGPNECWPNTVFIEC